MATPYATPHGPAPGVSVVLTCGTCTSGASQQQRCWLPEPALFSLAWAGSTRASSACFVQGPLRPFGVLPGVMCWMMQAHGSALRLPQERTQREPEN